jgi:hypothetical protein
MAKFSQELFDTICERIAQGESLRRICEDKDMPSVTAVNKWLAKDEGELVAQYARARESQADHFVDEIVGIADTAEDAQVARLQIDARKWVAGKMRPKKYGDKLDVTSDGEKLEFPSISVSFEKPD